MRVVSARVAGCREKLWLRRGRTGLLIVYRYTYPCISVRFQTQKLRMIFISVASLGPLVHYKYPISTFYGRSDTPLFIIFFWREEKAGFEVYFVFVLLFCPA